MMLQMWVRIPPRILYCAQYIFILSYRKFTKFKLTQLCNRKKQVLVRMAERVKASDLISNSQIMRSGVRFPFLTVCFWNGNVMEQQFQDSLNLLNIHEKKFIVRISEALVTYRQKCDEVFDLTREKKNLESKVNELDQEVAQLRYANVMQRKEILKLHTQLLKRTEDTELVIS